MRRALPVLAALALVGGSAAEAAVINVPADQPTIQAGVNAAVNPGDEVVLADGTYTGAGNCFIFFQGIDIVVRSASGDPATCVIDCQGSGPAFIIQNGEGLGAQLLDLTVRNGVSATGGGGVFALNTAPTIDNCIFESCDAVSGGGIWNNGNSVISNCQFVGCHATEFGGGIAYWDASATITGCDFQNNTTDTAGAGLFVGNSGTPMVSDCTFTGNVGGLGGGVETSFSAAGMFVDCTFAFNTPSGMAATNGNPSIIRCLFAENGGGAASTASGGLYLSNCDGIVSASRFHRNASAAAGGGIGIENGSDATITGCSLVENDASDVGGGMYVDASSPFLERCTFIGNSAATGSGEALFITSGSPSLQGSLVLGNSGGIAGVPSAIENAGGSLTLTDTLVCGSAGDEVVGGFTDGGGNRIQDSCPCWSDGFETYADASSIDNQGRWAAWDESAAFGDALVTSVESLAGAQALEVEGPDDVVQRFSGLTSGTRTIITHQFIPTGNTGTTMFIVLNEYEPLGTYNWSLQLEMDMDLGIVTSMPEGTGLTLKTDQWVEIRVDIDLDANTQTIWYGGQLLTTKSWTEGFTGGGRADIDVIDLFGNGSDPVYYDGLIVCDVNVHNLTQDAWHGTIQSALDTAADGDEIEALPGTFYERISFPGGSIDYEIGGTLAPPDTVIDGEGLGTVVEFLNAGQPHGPTTVFHDVTIQNGSAANGGGVHMSSNSPTLERVWITSNSASGDGGGLRADDDCFPTLTEVLFQGNTAGGNGGGMAHTGGGTATFTRCRFAVNQATNGGGLYDTSVSEIHTAEFEINTAVEGAAIEIGGISTMTNCAIVNNTGTGGVGAIVNKVNAFAMNMTNCTIAANNGRGLENGGGTVNVFNSIIWGDTNGEIGGGGTTNVSFSDVQGGFAGTGNIDADPLLVNPAVVDVTVMAGSPVVNAGDDLAPNLPAEDFEGFPRIRQCRVDIGAAESDFFADDCNLDGVGDLCNIASDTYAADDGQADSATCWGSGTCSPDQTWAVQYDAGVGDVIGAVAVVFNGISTLQIGDPVTVYLWDDPNDDGIPDDIVLLSSAPGTIGVLSNVSDGLPDTFDVFPIPQANVSGSFFVGVTTTTGDFSIAIDTTNPLPGRSWGGGNTGDLGLPSEFTFPNAMVRARRVGDADGNGVPDPCDCPGDLNQDGVVDVVDLLDLLGQWGTTGPSTADLNFDGVVAVNDLLVVLDAWGRCP